MRCGRILSAFCAVAVSVGLAVSTATCACQISVDTTGQVKPRTRVPSKGSVGSIGRRLPLRVTFDSLRRVSDADSVWIVAFTLVNDGPTAISVPVFPSPGDVEPPISIATYEVQSLRLRITKGGKTGVPLQGEAEMYGSRDIAGSLKSLTPGSYMKVIGKVTLPPLTNQGDDLNDAVLVAHASLSTEIISTDASGTSLDMREDGSVESVEYSAVSLMRSH